jgi:hypothetical protein
VGLPVQGRCWIPRLDRSRTIPLSEARWLLVPALLHVGLQIPIPGPDPAARPEFTPGGCSGMFTALQGLAFGLLLERGIGAGRIVRRVCTPGVQTG